MLAQSGMNVKPFGVEKLKIVDWLHSLIMFKDRSLVEQLQRLKLPEQLFALMKQYFMNSFLHLRLNKLFEEAFKTGDDLYVNAVRK